MPRIKKVTLTIELKFTPAWNDTKEDEFNKNVKEWTEHIIFKLREGYINRQVWATKVSGKVKINKG